MRTGSPARRQTERWNWRRGLCLLAWLSLWSVAPAGTLEFDFDGPEVSWQVRCRQREATLETQERRREGARQGQAEFVRVRASAERTPLRVEHEIPASQVLDEFTASLWFRANRPGATLAIRIAFRDRIDPDTSAPVTMLIIGDRYEDANKWQRLQCRTTDKSVNDQLRLLRAMKKGTLDRSAMYIDRILIGTQLDTGATELWFDHMDVGPLVPVSESGDSIQLTRAEDSIARIGSAAEQRGVPVEFRLHKLRVDGKPFFPRMVPHRNEHPERISDVGANVAWVPDVDALTNTGQFRDRGIWLTATPPFAKGADDLPLDSDDASLLPFTASSSSVLFWTLGVRMTAGGRPRLPSWTNQVRDADRSFRRPLAADMASDERIASRHLDLVGLSRHVLGSGLTLAEFRDEIIRRRDRAWPGTFCFTWIQTEPPQELLDLATLAGTTPVIEPEQIRLQVYAALAAGCRGIGYWTTQGLDADLPGARERQLMLTQLNLELALLEPWLATGSTVQLVPFTLETSARDRNAAANPKDPERELKAALIRSEFGALVLPMWLEANSQYVPPALASGAATIVVPGGGETATAWQIATSGRIQNLNRETIAGGIRITIPKFDQTAAILITSDLSIMEQINQRIAAIQERSAAVTVELCRLKLERVRLIDQELTQLGVGQSEARPLLGQAKLQLDMADARLKQQDYNTARQYANEALQLARRLQRAHWDRAVADLATPLSSPYTLCFQTLPAHWRLMNSFQKLDARREPNRLPSGDFEDLDTLIAAGWRHEQHPIDNVQSAAELHPLAHQGRTSLRLAAEPTVREPSVFDFHFAPVSVTSPAVTVHAGQVARISGWVKTPYPMVRSPEGLVITDSLLGKTGALRFKNCPDWQRFEVWRVAPSSQTMTINLELHGLGEILVDELAISTAVLSSTDSNNSAGREPEKPARSSPLGAFDLRRLSPLRERK